MITSSLNLASCCLISFHTKHLLMWSKGWLATVYLLHISGIARFELMVGPQLNVYHDPIMDKANLNSLPGQVYLHSKNLHHLVIVIIHIILLTQ